MSTPNVSGEIREATERLGKRAICPVCRKAVPITASGVLRKHSTYATVCPQSGSEVPYDCVFVGPAGRVTPLGGPR